MFNKTYALHIINIYVENILYFYVLNASEHVPCVLEVISCVEELHTLYIVYSNDNNGSNYKHA